MTQPTVIQLRKDEDRRLRAGHLWVFSNEVDVRATPLNSIEPGQLVDVRDSRGAWIGSGYGNPRSLITARLLTRDPAESIDEDLLRGRLRVALALREGLFPGEPFYRLVFGEGDGLPGLVVDRFGEILVVQPSTAGIEALLDTLVSLLVELTGATGVLIRADSTVRQYEGLDLYSRTAHGTIPETVRIRENGVLFDVPILTGQKTGWFFDHRASRSRLSTYVRDKRVLDVFSYLGGWGVHAAVAGAAEVTCIDSSSSALQGVTENAELNGVAAGVRTERADAFEALQRLRDDRERFDVVILDPPAFIKRKKDLREGERAYRRLNRLALELLGQGGILVSASCSFHMGRDLLLRAILWGAVGANRDVQVIEEGHQAQDHPFHPAIPETNYLKTFFTRIVGERR